MAGVPTDGSSLLDMLFDPTQEVTLNAAATGGALPEAPPAAAPPSDPELKEVGKRVKELAESGDLEGALRFLDEELESRGKSGILLNDRAQVHRLSGDLAAARRDLDEAIGVEEEKLRLAGKEVWREEGGPEWGEQTPALYNAYTQRAALRREVGEPEAAISLDLKAAAFYGSKLARAVVEPVNPYAALCSMAVDAVMKAELEKAKGGEEKGDGGE